MCLANCPFNVIAQILPPSHMFVSAARPSAVLAIWWDIATRTRAKGRIAVKNAAVRSLTHRDSVDTRDDMLLARLGQVQSNSLSSREPKVVLVFFKYFI